MNTEKSVNLQHILDWKSIDWKPIEEYVMKLQQRIFLAEKNKNPKVKELQKTLIHSKANLLLSIRKVTQLTTGNRAAGIDNYKVLPPKERCLLYEELLHSNIVHHKPLQTSLKLPSVSKPVIKDRILQYVIKHALEPQWEARFEANSYGFRPGRSIHDAIGSIYNKVGPKKKRKWICKISLKGCFATIQKEFLLRLFDDFPYKNVLERWIKANYIDSDVFHRRDTSQGRIITPLLANILLHGLESLLGVTYNKRHVQKNMGPCFVRYGDEIAIFHYTEEEAKEYLHKLTVFFSERGIDLKNADIKICHINQGFDFSDFTIRVYDADPHNASNLNEKLLITPSKTFIQNVKQKLKACFEKCKGRDLKTLLDMINPIIIKTAYYLRTVVSSPAFKHLDHYIDYKIYKYLKRMHANKSWTWIKTTYFKRCKQKSQGLHVYDSKTDTTRRCFRDIPIRRHVLISFEASPFDPNLKDYWGKRNI